MTPARRKDSSFAFAPEKIRYVVLPLVLANDVFVEISAMQHVAVLALRLFFHVNEWLDFALRVLDCLLRD